MLPFHDISYAQGLYNMAANTDPMVMMKASGFYTGSLQPYVDAQLVRNYADVKQYGKIPFMYHFFVPAVDPNVQAAWFLRAVSPLAVGDGYAVDVEIDGPNLVQDVLTFVQDHHTNTGCYPWVYLDRYLRQKYDWSSVFSLCSEWIAAPDVPFTANISGIGVYVAQQGPIVNGVDTDEYFGTLESIKSYTYGYHAPQAPVAVPTPQPVPTPTPTPTPTPIVTPPTQPTPPTVLPGLTNNVPPASKQTTSTTNTPPSVDNASTSQTPPKATYSTLSWWAKIVNWFLRLIGIK